MLAQRLRQRCERAGYAAHADTVLQWLGAVVRTPLPGVGAPLQGLNTVLPEMEFWLPVHAADARRIDALARAHTFAGAPRPSLAHTLLAGMLKGFIDLVFEHDGRFWILDWKSNHLGAQPQDYAPARLEAAMQTHGYHLQHLLYSVALHRHLGRSLAGYDYESHFGGVLYLFVRGVRPQWRIDGVPCGVFHQRCPAAVLASLDALLAGVGAPHVQEPI